MKKKQKKKTPYIAFTLLEQLFAVKNNEKISPTLIVKILETFLQYIKHF